MAQTVFLTLLGIQQGCMESPRVPAVPVPLSELASQVAEKAEHCSLVIVGESSHGVAEFGRFKLEVIQELHRRGRAGLILLESPFVGSFGISLFDTSLTASAFLDSTTYRVWHTTAYRDLVRYLREQAQTGDTIPLVCIDPNVLASAAHQPLSRALRSAFTVASDSNRLLASLAPVLDELHSIEQSGARTPVSTARARILVQAGREKLGASLERPISDSARVGIAVARALLDSFGMWADAATDTSTTSQMLLRDRRMARMVALAREDLYPNTPTVLLTHNWHARRHAGEVRLDSIPSRYPHAQTLYPAASTPADSFRSLGGLLTRESPDSTFVLGLYFDHGETTLNDQSVVRIAPSRAGTLEHRVLNTCPGGGFITFHSQPRGFLPPWWECEQRARYWGLWDETFVPARQYDGVVVIPVAGRPTYTGTGRN